MVRMFADDTKVFADASARGAVQEIQEDIIRLDNWAKEWQLTFNAKKCKVMYVGKKNPCHDYKMEQDGVQIKLERTRNYRRLISGGRSRCLTYKFICEDVLMY